MFICIAMLRPSLLEQAESRVAAIPRRRNLRPYAQVTIAPDVYCECVLVPEDRETTGNGSVHRSHTGRNAAPDKAFGLMQLPECGG
jgi:hypothetical protein